MLYANHTINSNYSRMTKRALLQLWADLIGKPYSARYLISESVKVIKGEKYGYHTAITYMPAATQFKGGHTCSNEKLAGCGKNCLVHSGHLASEEAEEARKDRLQLLIKDPALFFEIYRREALTIKRACESRGILQAGRMNGTTDLDWTRILFDNRTIFEHIPWVTWYDYTKNPNLADNYLSKGIHITVSWYKKLDTQRVLRLLDRGVNIAIAYRDRVPSTHKIGDRIVEVISGDDHDLRFKDPKGVVIGLKFKNATFKEDARLRNAMALESGYIINSDTPIV